MLLKALSIAHLRFVGPQPLQMLAKSISNQRRAVYFRMLGGLVGRAKQILIQHDLDCLHMWTMLDTKYHSQARITF